MTRADSDPGDPLSRGPFRSVFLLPGSAGGTDVVIKRFHHRHPLKRLRDGVRATREYRVLSRLHDAGVRVPRPLELVEGRPAWDVRMEAVTDATPLERLFLEGAAPRGGWEAFLERLGRELARVQEARVRLHDLGPKNVLVDGRGCPWLIDFHDARLGRREFTRSEARADVVAAAAAGRESLPPRLRLRFLATWLRASGHRRHELDLTTLEAAARRLRRTLVARGIGRWLRESSRCHTTTAVGRTTITRRDRAEDAATLPAVETAAEEGRARWLNAARLLEHGIPAARPGRLELAGGRATLVFDAPLRWTTEDELRKLVLDRGLDLTSWERACLVGPDGGAGLRPPAGLLEPRVE